jgi:hypothetical protein
MKASLIVIGAAVLAVLAGAMAGLDPRTETARPRPP